jgi:competence ComEA-like helix-hairpin-helix protein
MNRSYVSDPQPAEGTRAGELASRLDPNSATWQELAGIPSLGEKRAKAIADYRDVAHSRDPTATVFRSAGDLMRVRGIGTATVENLKPYLVFPGERPRTRP